MNPLEVSARMTVRPGQTEGFKKQAAEVLRLTKELDTRTLRYDWFLTESGEVEIREAYEDSDAFIEHRKHVDEALRKLFAEFADNHVSYVFGEVSPDLRERAEKMMPPGTVKWFSFLHGLEIGNAIDFKSAVPAEKN